MKLRVSPAPKARIERTRHRVAHYIDRERGSSGERDDPSLGIAPLEDHA